jgi:hypothetical protein
VAVARKRLLDGRVPHELLDHLGIEHRHRSRAIAKVWRHSWRVIGRSSSGSRLPAPPSRARARWRLPTRAWRGRRWLRGKGVVLPAPKHQIRAGCQRMRVEVVAKDGQDRHSANSRPSTSAQSAPRTGPRSGARRSRSGRGLIGGCRCDPLAPTTCCHQLAAYRVAVDRLERIHRVADRVDSRGWCRTPKAKARKAIGLLGCIYATNTAPKRPPGPRHIGLSLVNDPADARAPY